MAPRKTDTPKRLVKKIQEAQNRIKRVEGKKVLVKKPSASPVNATSKAAQRRRQQDRLSLKDIMIETTPRTRQLMREGNVEVSYIKRTKSGRVIMCETVTHKPKGEVSKYRQVIRNEDPYDIKFSNSKAINLDCTCPRFKFAHDYVLHQKDASDLNYSTNEPPDITNPMRLLGSCKHLYRCLQLIVQKGL